MSDTMRNLTVELKKIWDNRDFVCGVISNAGDEKSWSIILDYIDTARKKGVQISSDEILFLSLDLAEENEGLQTKRPLRKIAAAML